MTYLDITTAPYNGSGNGVADNVSALNLALSALTQSTAKGGTIYFPAGRYLFSSQVSKGLLSLQDISIVGDGADATVLFWPDAGGLVLNCSTGAANPGTFHIRDLTFETGKSGIGNGLTLGAANNGATGSRAVSSVDRVGFRGSAYPSDPGGSYWANGLQISVSNINVNDCTFSASYSIPPSPSPIQYYGRGILAISQYPGTTPGYAVVLNVQGCNFQYIQYGIVAGDYTQGLRISSCNFTECFAGIANTPNAASQLQLAVTGCQFGFASYGILFNKAIQGSMISSNLFLTSKDDVAVKMETGGAFAFVGNTILPNTSRDGKGIYISSSIVIPATTNPVAPAVYKGGTIVGNYFDGQSIAIQLGSDTKFVNVQSNVYFSNTISVQNSGVNNVIGGGSA